MDMSGGKDSKWSLKRCIVATVESVLRESDTTPHAIVLHDPGDEELSAARAFWFSLTGSKRVLETRHTVVHMEVTPDQFHPHGHSYVLVFWKESK